jgi:hypothetical protein
MSKEGQGCLSSLGLGFGAALLGWALAIGMFAAYLVVAVEYLSPRIGCTTLEPIMFALGLLMLVVILATSVAATNYGAKVWRVNFRPALLLTALFLAPLVAAWPTAMWFVSGCGGD